MYMCCAAEEELSTTELPGSFFLVPALMRHADPTLLAAVGTSIGTVQGLLGHFSSESTREVYFFQCVTADARGGT